MGGTRDYKEVKAVPPAMCAFVRAFVRACVRACVRGCVHACLRVRAWVWTLSLFCHCSLLRQKHLHLLEIFTLAPFYSLIIPCRLHRCSPHE